MNAEERRELWEGLALVEDWALGGVRRSRMEPDFAAAEALEAARVAAGGSAIAAEPEALAAVGAEVARCAACRLAASRARAVFGEGSASPLVLVVGESPGEEEDERGLPFAGPAGQLLDKMLGAVGLSRKTNCYLTDVVKCRPPASRDPSPDEEEACLGYLRRQAAILRPRYLLCVGRVAARALTGSKDGIDRLRGRWLSFDGIPLVATFHPSALLRDESLKRPAWEDLKLLRSRMVEDGAFPAGGGTARDA